MHRACIPVLLPVPLRPDTCLVPFCTRCYLQNYFITFLDNWNISLQDQNTPNKWMLQKTLRWLAVAVRVNKLNWERVPYTTGSLKTSLCCSSQQPGKEQTLTFQLQAGNEKAGRMFFPISPLCIWSAHKPALFSSICRGKANSKDTGKQTETH